MRKQTSKQTLCAWLMGAALTGRIWKCLETALACKVSLSEAGQSGTVRLYRFAKAE